VEFDADGNMITGPLFDDMTTFRFDSRNRLIGVADTVYRYDAENQRFAVNAIRYVINPQAVLRWYTNLLCVWLGFDWRRTRRRISGLSL